MIKDLLLNELKNTIKKIEKGQCEMSDEQMQEMLKVFAHQPMSKQEACWFLDIHRSKFDYLVREGILPQGRKRPGFKELSWYKDELELIKDQIQLKK